MASLQSNITNFSPNIYSILTITEKSRSGTSVVLNISITSHLRYSSSYLGSGYVIKGTVNANGTTKAITLKSSGGSWSGTTEHTTTTTMQITVPASTTSITIKYQATISGNGESGSGNTASASLNLSKVLATTTSATSFSDTTNPIVYFSNPSNFKIRPYINLYTQQTGGTFLGSTIYPENISSTGALINSPYTWTLSETQRNNIRNWLGTKTSAWANVGVDTYDGNTKLGYSSKGVAVTNVLSPPTFSDFEYEDINNKTLNITGNKNNFILGYSTLRITIEGDNKAVANKGATMSYYLVNGQQYTYSDTIIIDIENWQNDTIEITAVDSRGTSTKVTKTINTVIYTPLEKGGMNATRDGNISEETKLTYSGKVQRLLPNGQQNNLSVLYKYKKVNEDVYTNGTTTITPQIDNEGNFSFEDYIVGDIATGFNIDESYNILVEISDALSSIQYLYTLNSGIPALAIKGNNIAIHGGYDETLGGTQFNGDTYLNGSRVLTLEDIAGTDLINNNITTSGTLNKSIENYKRIKVYALNNDNVSVCTEIYNNNYGQVSATLQTIAVGGTENYIYSATVTFNNTSVSLSRKSVTRVRNNNTSYVTSLNSAMTIIKIVGFKY